MRAIRRLFLLSLAAVPAACSGEESGGGAPDAAPDVTWHQDIAPLVAEHCVGCHTEGGIGPFSLESYEEAAERVTTMVSRVKNGEMPPWDAVSTDDCETRHEWRDDPRLSEEEIALLDRWKDLGAPEGDPDDAAPLPEPPSLVLDDATHTVAPEVGFATEGDTDQFICFVLDPGIDEPTWVTGVHMVPSDLSVAHHAVATVVPPDGQDELAALAGEDGVYDCFGGVNLPGAYLLGVWVPGSLPFETPADVGIPLAADARVVVQLHYHPAGKSHEAERTELQLRVTDVEPARVLVFTGIGNAPSQEAGLLPGPNDDGSVQFKVPADVADHIESMELPIDLETPQRFPVLSVFPHMHYVGVDLQVKVSRATPGPGEPATECLVKVPTWDFEWQRTYLYDAPVDELPTLGDGDILTITCRYDNTMDNPYVERALDEASLPAPVDVFLGEQTLDEMCLAAFGVIF